jgi:hypothetical protein
VGRPLSREDGSVFCMCRWPLPAQSSSVLVPWDLRPHFTVSDLRLPFSSPPTTRRVTVEVFDPASTRVSNLPESESYITTDGQSASLSWYKAPIRGLRPDFYFRTEYGIRALTLKVPRSAHRIIFLSIIKRMVSAMRKKCVFCHRKWKFKLNVACTGTIQIYKITLIKETFAVIFKMCYPRW